MHQLETTRPKPCLMVMLYHSDVAHHAHFACHVSPTVGTGVLRDTLAQTLAGVAGWTVSNHLITNILETTRSSAIHFDNYAHANPYRRPCTKVRSCIISVLGLRFHPAQKAQFHPRRGCTNYHRNSGRKVSQDWIKQVMFFFDLSPKQVPEVLHCSTWNLQTVYCMLYACIDLYVHINCMQQ